MPTPLEVPQSTWIALSLQLAYKNVKHGELLLLTIFYTLHLCSSKEPDTFDHYKMQKCKNVPFGFICNFPCVEIQMVKISALSIRQSHMCCCASYINVLNRIRTKPSVKTRYSIFVKLLDQSNQIRVCLSACMSNRMSYEKSDLTRLNGTYVAIPANSTSKEVV